MPRFREGRLCLVGSELTSMTHPQVGALDRASLGRINAYNPGLSGAWMLQRAMSVRPGHPPAADFINRLLGQNFAAMQRMGDPVLKPFLQVGCKAPLGPGCELCMQGWNSDGRIL